MYNGKRSDKIRCKRLGPDLPHHLRFDEEMGNAIREHAEANCRTLQLEVLYLIKLGLQRAREIDALLAAEERTEAR